MKLYLISQSVNNGYDTYDSAVIAARDEDSARLMYPGYDLRTWTAPEFVTVEYIGTAKPCTKAGTVICASFNAG